MSASMLEMVILCMMTSVIRRSRDCHLLHSPGAVGSGVAGGVQASRRRPVAGVLHRVLPDHLTRAGPGLPPQGRHLANDAISRFLRDSFIRFFSCCSFICFMRRTWSRTEETFLSCFSYCDWFFSSRACSFCADCSFCSSLFMTLSFFSYSALILRDLSSVPVSTVSDGNTEGETDVKK
ncbi:hypothetical protein EYF80_052898 [Liparis tanakae]|uniref:Uncharacterized protein n=1 Tax=Liparis tanakae TaxID=230148 RepID=A0A4Z2F7Z5_9TELE|nr:hypothetical protein EYF80_052898 [Liparis tanakae]